VGNGGIATELVYEIENCKVIWAIKDKHACNHLFFDEMASRFFTKRLNENKVSNEQSDEVVSKRKNYSIKSKTKFQTKEPFYENEIILRILFKKSYSYECE
jgi:pyridine nucleotide-disulfide oxidoreductase domain-containing protein 1